MKGKVLVLGFLLMMSVFTSAENSVRVVYGGYLGHSKDDIIKFKDMYTDKAEKEELIESGRVFYVPAETVLKKKQEIYGHYEEYLYDGKTVYGENLSVQDVKDKTI